MCIEPFDVIDTRWPSGLWLVTALADTGPGVMMYYMQWEESRESLCRICPDDSAQLVWILI